MPVYDSAFDNVLDNDADFQQFVQKYEAAILASGFLEVAPDTGQLNPLTIARPGAINTYAGYRIYRAKDPLAATRPFYVKIEYGVGSTLDRPFARRTLGTGSNGAGTLTGPVSTAVVLLGPSVSGSGAGTIRAGGTEHSSWIYVHDSSQTTHQAFFAVGRLLNQTDGVAEDAILWEVNASSGTAVIGSTYMWSDGATAWASVSNGFLTHFPDPGGLPCNGGDVNTVRLFEGLVYRDAKARVFPLLVGRAGELPFTNPVDSRFSINVWGRMRTFLPVPQNALISSTAQSRLALPWED